VFGTLFTLLSAYTWPTALQRGYEIAWRVPSLGWRGLWRPLAWLTSFVGVGAVLIVLPPAHILAEPWRTLLLLLLGAPLVLGWAWWTQHFLLRRAVAWRLLLPGAIAMTIGLLALRGAAGMFASAMIIDNYEQYGPLGIVFMLLSWLVAFSVVMLGGPVLGAALHEHRVLAGRSRAPAPPPAPPPAPASGTEAGTEAAGDPDAPWTAGGGAETRGADSMAAGHPPGMKS
jgi:membrane protein